QFFDHRRRNNVVIQSYNPAGDPTGGGLDALRRVQATWSGVPGSTFRFSFGGLTTRCPSLLPECGGQPDGYNDVGWAHLAFVGAHVLAVDEAQFDLRTGEALETDVLLNTDISPRTWFTDGVNVPDVESVMLHEDGHALGLGHSPDPSAVMNADICTSAPCRRTLSPIDIDAVLALYPTHPSLLTDIPSAHDFNVVAERDTPAPGGGNFLDHFEPGAVNAGGDLAFVTNVPEGQGLFIASRKGDVKQVGRTGMTIGGVLLGLGSLANVGINDSGDVGFCWLAGPFDSPFGINGGVFRANANGLIDPIVLPGITPAPGGGVFVGCIGSTISNGGDIAFTGLVQRAGGPVENAVFVARGNGPLARVAGPGDAAPGGGVFAIVARPTIAPNGRDVAFAARISGDQGRSIFVSRGPNGTLDAIARFGAPALGNFIENTFTPLVNSSGDVLYGVAVPTQDPLSFSTPISLVVAHRNGATQVIAQHGDVLPDGLPFGTAPIGAWSLNETGDVAFVSEVGPLTSVYASSRGRLRFVARSGSVLLGIGQISSVDVPLIDERGDVVFIAETVDVDRLLLLRAGRKAQIGF
ncbi:MAG TPA: choice-of-anchor tandem repeat NxxGxxAF-containing protein, partial [Acidimicrobiia bacterium]|nr:choice-of-anchor tandem repeat NxxGxxAF-containing protein [Acidimicrobiia bacterium]